MGAAAAVRGEEELFVVSSFDRRTYSPTDPYRSERLRGLLSLIAKGLSPASVAPGLPLMIFKRIWGTERLSDPKVSRAKASRPTAMTAC
jgi:hypothetical protein